MNKKDKKKESELKSEKPAIVFRFDGTLMDTTPAVLASWRHVFAKYDPSFDFSREVQIMALNESTMEMAMSYLPKEDPREVANEFRTWQLDHLKSMIAPVKGAKDLLKWLKKEGYRTAVISNRDRFFMMELLEHGGLAEYLDVVVGKYDSMDGRFDASNVVKASKLLHTDNVIYVGDSGSRVMAAKYLGAYAIGILGEYGNTADMIEAGADFLTANIMDVKKILQGEPLWKDCHLTDPQQETIELDKIKKKAKEKLAKKQAEHEGKKKKKKQKDAEKETAEAAGVKEKKKDKKDKKDKKNKKNKKEKETKDAKPVKEEKKEKPAKEKKKKDKKNKAESEPEKKEKADKPKEKKKAK